MLREMLEMVGRDASPAVLYASPVIDCFIGVLV